MQMGLQASADLKLWWKMLQGEALLTVYTDYLLQPTDEELEPCTSSDQTLEQAQPALKV